MIDLRLGDCLQVMATMPDSSVNIVFTSPPYNVGLKYKDYDDSREWSEYLTWLETVYAEMFRVCADGARVYSILSDRLMFELRSVIERVGFTYTQVLTWCKPNFCGGAGRMSNDWNYMTEQILLFRKGKRTPMLNGVGNTHSYFVVTGTQSNFKEGRIHPAQFPIELPVKIISRTPGETVFDPFMGSASVGIACLKLERNFIGCEIDPDYFQAAEKRISDFQQQPKLEIAL